MPSSPISRFLNTSIRVSLFSLWGSWGVVTRHDLTDVKETQHKIHHPHLLSLVRVLSPSDYCCPVLFRPNNGSSLLLEVIVYSWYLLIMFSFVQPCFMHIFKSICILVQLFIAAGARKVYIKWQYTYIGLNFTFENSKLWWVLFFYDSTVWALRFLNQQCHFMPFNLCILGVPAWHILSIRYTMSARSKNVDSLLWLRETELPYHKFLGICLS